MNVVVAIGRTFMFTSTAAIIDSLFAVGNESNLFAERYYIAIDQSLVKLDV